MKKSYYCKKLETTLHFLPDEVKYCCSCTRGLGYKIDKFSNLNIKNVLNEKYRYIEILAKGEIPEGCIGCSEYKQMSLLKKILYKLKCFKFQKVSYLIADHFKQCDCVCIYCSQKKIFPNITQNYELLPIIKQLYSLKKLEEKHLCTEFQGGNVSLLKEFENLINEMKKHKCTHFVILSNMIRYLPIFENLDKESGICVSIDAGTRETFCKIKQVDAFDKVIENINKTTTKSSIYMSVKYILIKDVNDNLQEVIKFLEMIKKLHRVDKIVFDIDYNNTFMSKDNTFKVPEHYKDIIEYVNKFCIENNYIYYMPQTIKTLV